MNSFNNSFFSEVVIILCNSVKSCKELLEICKDGKKIWYNGKKKYRKHLAHIWSLEGKFQCYPKAVFVTFSALFRVENLT